MQRSLKPICLALGLAASCSLVNKFDPVNDVPAAGGSGGKAGHSAGGEAGVGGTEVTGGSANGGKAGTTAIGEGGAGGDNGVTGDPIPGGLVVVGTNVGSVPSTAKHFVVLLDAASGQEIARTQTTLPVLAIAYESARDLWFVFTGTPGQGGADPNGPLLVGPMTTTGFQVQQTVTVPKPTSSNVVAILNQRILYRSAVHSGALANATIDDALTLLNTGTNPVKPIGKLSIPYKYSLASVVGRPASGTAPGGRVFFLHENLDDAMENCVAGDAGTEDACTVYYSSLNVLTGDTNLSLQPAAISPVAQVDKDGSFAALGITSGSSGSTVAVVVPPRRAIGPNAAVYKYSAGTGAIEPGGPILFTLNSPSKMVNTTMSISIAATALDPCVDLLFAGELANTGLLYAVPIGSPSGPVVPFDPQSKNGTVGGITYEPFTKTLISFNNDLLNPTFSGFQIGGTATAPTVTVRGKTGALPWKIPAGLVPGTVVAKTPDSPPCSPTAL